MFNFSIFQIYFTLLFLHAMHFSIPKEKNKDQNKQEDKQTKLKKAHIKQTPISTELIGFKVAQIDSLVANDIHLSEYSY